MDQDTKSKRGFKMRHFIYILFALALINALTACKSDPPPGPVIEVSSNPTTIIVPPALPPTIDCTGASKVVEGVRLGKLMFPLKGKMVEESHYQTTEDFKVMGHYPDSSEEGIHGHLSRACQLYRLFSPQTTCLNLYTNAWEKVWTPSEGGFIGQGSLGGLRPTPEKEMWQGNMYLKTNFPLNTRILARANGKQVVLYFGHEQGPADKRFIGGMSVEAHAWLGTDNDSIVELIYLKDQTNAWFGPATCKE